MSQLSSKGLNVILADSFTGCITQANASGQHINILHYSFIPEAPALATLFLVNEIYKSLLPETQNYRKLLQELYAIDGVNDLIGFLQEHEEYKTDFLKTLVKSNIFHYLSRLEILNLAEERDVDTEKLAEFLRENTATFDFQDMYSIGSGYIYADFKPSISSSCIQINGIRICID
jgi:hypothetical protein